MLEQIDQLIDNELIAFSRIITARRYRSSLVLDH